MIRILLLLTAFTFSSKLFPQHLLITRLENTSLVQWAENRLTVIIEGYKCKDIVVTATNGHVQLNPADCEIIYRAPDTAIHHTVIKIGVKSGRSIHWLREMDLPVLKFPDPVPSVGGLSPGSTITKAVFVAQQGITVPVTDGWHLVQSDSQQTITSYSIRITRKDSVLYLRNDMKGNRFPGDMFDFIKSFSTTGDEITFFDIDTLLYNKERRRLKDIYTLIIQ